jgi:regulator of protease activity HflC (stomatin/prohibitin superfamily)
MFIDFDAFSIFVIGAVALAFVVIWMSAQRVPQGLEYTVERFGRYTKTDRKSVV